MTSPCKWGVVTTTNAAQDAILQFAAFHLEAGAHRIWVFLDRNAPETFDVLQAHPKLRVIQTDAAYWDKKGGRPDMHQPRQSRNARHAYHRSKDVDWLGHIDTDEFLFFDNPLSEALSALPLECMTARIRPIEALAPGEQAAGHGQYFRGFVADRQRRQDVSARVYPTFGPYLNGGFLSHVAGKIFVRTGHKNVRIKIHNAWFDGVENPGQIELQTGHLCHLHAKDWHSWRAQFDYRLQQGAYRKGLKNSGAGLLSLNELLGAVMAESGEAGLRAFYDEVCVATPDHLSRLKENRILYHFDLRLDEIRNKHFPNS